MTPPLSPGLAASAPRGSLLPALVGVVLALLAWVAGEDQREQLPALQQQLKTTSALVARGAADDVLQLKAAALDARAQRAALEARLQSDESLQMTRARMVFDLRQKCAAALVAGCAVRLSDEVVAASPAARGAAGAAPPAPRQSAAASGANVPEVTLDMLGISKARAIISGTFQNRELLALYQSLVSDGAAQWRVNGIVVRSNAFELDVERHLRTVAAVSAGKP